MLNRSREINQLLSYSNQVSNPKSTNPLSSTLIGIAKGGRFEPHPAKIKRNPKSNSSIIQIWK